MVKEKPVELKNYDDPEWSDPEKGADGLERWLGLTKEDWLEKIPGRSLYNLRAFALLGNHAPIELEQEEKFQAARNIGNQLSRLKKIYGERLLGFSIHVYSSSEDDSPEAVMNIRL